MKKEIISVALIVLCLVAVGVAGEIVWKIGGESLVAIPNEWLFNVSNTLVLKINASGLYIEGNASVIGNISTRTGYKMYNNYSAFEIYDSNNISKYKMYWNGTELVEELV